MKLSPTQLEKVNNLRTSMILNVAMGNYKEYKSTRKEYAKLAVQDFDAIKKLPHKPKISVPLFSKIGMNMIYIGLRDMFRIKTPEEKLLKRMGKEELIKRKLNLQG